MITRINPTKKKVSWTVILAMSLLFSGNLLGVLIQPIRNSVTTHQVKVPVVWQITHSAFRSGNIITTSENFREEWRLVFRHGATLEIHSPRGLVVADQLSFRNSSDNFPDSVVLGSPDLATLFGIEMTDQLSVQRILSLRFPTNAQTFEIHGLADVRYHVVVQLRQ